MNFRRIGWQIEWVCVWVGGGGGRGGTARAPSSFKWLHTCYCSIKDTRISLKTNNFSPFLNDGRDVIKVALFFGLHDCISIFVLCRFLYSDEVQIGPETVMTTLYTAKKYAVPALEAHCVEFLKKNLRADNAFMLLTQVRSDFLTVHAD